MVLDIIQKPGPGEKSLRDLKSLKYCTMTQGPINAVN